MSNLTSVTIANGVPTGGSGTVSTIDALMADGGQATLGATAGVAVISDAPGTLQQYLRGIVKLFAAGINTVVTAALPAGTNVIGSVGVASSTTAAAASPAVTAGAYTAGFVMGGIMTFAGLLDAARFAGVLESITIKFKGTAVTGGVTLVLFGSSPSGGTYTDHAAPTWNAADMATLVGVYTLSTPLSPLGAMTVYNLDGIGKAVQGLTQNLFGVLIVAGTPTPASVADLTVAVAMLPG